MGATFENQASIFFSGASDYTRTYSPDEIEHIQMVECFCAAIRLGDERIVRTLVDEGFDINATIEVADQGIYIRPLTIAILAKQEKIAEMLIAKGAEVGNASLDIPTYGASEILAALKMKPKESISRLMALEAIRTRLREHQVDTQQNENASQTFLASRSPLVAACYVKSIRLVESLLEAGAEFGEYYYLALTAALDTTVECSESQRMEIIGTIIGARDRIGFDRFVGATQDFEQYVNGEWRRSFAGKEYNPSLAAQEKAFEACDRILTSPAYKKRLPLAQLLYAKFRELTLDDIIDSIVDVSNAIDNAEDLDALMSALVLLNVRKFCALALTPILVVCTPRPSDKKTVVLAIPRAKITENGVDAFNTTTLPLIKEKAPSIEFDNIDYEKVIEEISLSGNADARIRIVGSALGSKSTIGEYRSLFEKTEAKQKLEFLSLASYPDLIQSDDDKVVYFDRASIERIANFWNDENLGRIKNYLKCQYASSFASLIEAKTSEQPIAWQFSTFSDLCGHLITRELSPAYLEHVLDDKAIGELRNIFQNVKSAYRVAIGKSQYLTSESRNLAINKLDSITLRIVGDDASGFDLEGNLIIDDWNFIDNANRLFSLTNQKQYDDAIEDGENPDGTPSSGYSWLHNAAYNIQLNCVELYAAYLLPPAYSPRRSSVMNYAAIGRVIGHEISHAFDPKAIETLGSLAGNDNSVDIFSTSPTYATNIAKLKRQFEGKIPRRLVQTAPILVVNNSFDNDKWVGENFADVVGLEIALLAYAISQGFDTVKDLVESKPDDVRLFMQSYALSFRSKPSKEWLMYQMLYDTHAPDEFRVNTVKNLDAFHSVFETKECDEMWLAPEDRVSIFGIE